MISSFISAKAPAKKSWEQDNIYDGLDLPDEADWLDRELITGEPTKRINPKTDVMPSTDPEMSFFDEHRESLASYLEEVSDYSRMRRTKTLPHPIFGPFTAHQWHCMLGFHLQLHLRQADKVAQLVQGQPRP